MREKIVTAIVDLGGDELQTEELIWMAKATEEELVERLLHIAQYYKALAEGE